MYNPNIRINNPVYLLRQVRELMLIAKENKSTSPLIYACLDARIALEIVDLNCILHSVSPEERIQIIEDSKPKNGIEKINKKYGVLKQKYQDFFQAVCEVLNLNGKSYDYKKSRELQYKLSTYIHSYHLSPDELCYNSQTMQNAITILEEFQSFLKNDVSSEKNSFTILGFNYKEIPKADKEILEIWKNSKTMTYDELVFQLKRNHV